MFCNMYTRWEPALAETPDDSDVNRNTDEKLNLHVLLMLSELVSNPQNTRAGN